MGHKPQRPALSESRSKLTGKTRPRYETAAVFNPDGLPVWADRHRLDADVAAHDHDFLEIALVTQGRGLHIAADGDLGVTCTVQGTGRDECRGLVTSGGQQSRAPPGSFGVVTFAVSAAGIHREG